MSAPAVIDSLDFARAGEALSGSLPVAGLARLDDLLHDADGTLKYELRGSRDARNRPQLELHVTGRLHLQCQRCLGLLDYPVDLANTLLVLPRGTPADDELDDPEGPDAIEADPELDVAALVEDEVLLSLPLSPRHADEACDARIPANEVPDAGREPAFAKLAALKRTPNER